MVTEDLIRVGPSQHTETLNINREFIFKLIFAFILSLIPLGIYRICDLQTGKKKYALLSAFFFMSTPYSFYGIEPLAVERQIVATLFLILSVLLLVDKKLELRKRRIMFMIFSAALIISHYALAYIYLAYIAFIFILNNWIGPDSYWPYGYLPFDGHAILGFLFWAIPLSLFYAYLT